MISEEQEDRRFAIIRKVRKLRWLPWVKDRDGLYYFPVINGIPEIAKLYIHSFHDIKWID